ncbi:hypothetical protein AALO_G00268270 [Alosa alosa]|uniref:Uncharacterized protein n=1 Tax=Alosa alosa TaxID=278164 RepID=A0AAV6FM33_9TELE|nr:hypothetical protein AALO_G00268270 [Alosa alosa]
MPATVCAHTAQTTLHLQDNNRNVCQWGLGFGQLRNPSIYFQSPCTHHQLDTQPRFHVCFHSQFINWTHMRIVSVQK